MTMILLAALAAAAPAYASAYTPLNLDACRVIEQIEEGESVRWRCPGHAGIPLFVGSGDGRFDVDAGIDNEVWESIGAFNRPGTQVEWRTRGRTPIAIIFRLISVDAERPRRSVLMVETIGRAGRPGCRIATIDGALPNANALARAQADRRAPGFRCGIDRAEGPDLD